MGDTYAPLLLKRAGFWDRQAADRWVQVKRMRAEGASYLERLLDEQKKLEPFAATLKLTAILLQVNLLPSRWSQLFSPKNKHARCRA